MGEQGWTTKYLTEKITSDCQGKCRRKSVAYLGIQYNETSTAFAGNHYG